MREKEREIEIEREGGGGKENKLRSRYRDFVVCLSMFETESTSV